MKKIDILGISFGNFKRRKLRSVLTVLGVVIGTASIVTMMSLGIAIDDSFSKSMGDMGDLTTITVNPGYDEETGQRKGDMDDELVGTLKGIENVSAVTPEINLSGKLIAGRYQSYANILGVDMSCAEQMGLKLEKGKLLDDTTVSTARTIYAIFGSEAPYQFSIPKKRNGHSMMMGGMYKGGGDEDAEREPPPVDVMAEDARVRYTFDWSYGENNPADTSVKKKPVLYKVNAVGITSKQYDNTVYVDIETAKKIKKDEEKFNNSRRGGLGGSRSSSKQTYDGIRVFANSMENTVNITEQIKDMGYQAWSSAEWITTAKDQMKMIQMLLGGIGSVSLLVAAIGITNTMIMSIYERTREIGIMKVIGCYLKDIRTMFLVEAGFIGFFGGVVGVGLSYGLSAILNLVGKGGSGSMIGGVGPGSKLSIIPPWLALLAVVFAILVALISGFFPARRAMKLSALEAMGT